MASGEDIVFDDEVMTADDLIVEVQDDEPEKPAPPPASVKRSIPPPLPRS
jgi:hypothetical protein